MTTSVCPSPAIASAEANGSIVRTTPLLRLDDPNRRLARNSPAVAAITVARPRESRRLAPRGTVSFDPIEPVICVSGAT
jgi:hypothetical protein